MGSPGRNDPCPCGSGRKFKKCCLENERASAHPGQRLGALSPARGETTLIVETAAGALIRRVPNASPLATDLEQGKAAEAAIQDSAATWGMPDFVFRPVLDSRPGRVREVGDGLIIVGGLGLVIQSKSRVLPSEIDPDREERWLHKNAQRAASQAAGTTRTLRLGPRALENARGQHQLIDTPAIEWASVVVIDHPEIPDDVEIDAGAGVVVVLRRDWEFLFDQLRSSYAVARYLHRVADEPSVLGDEPARYFDLAQADEAAEPEVLAQELIGAGFRVSKPLLPMAPTGADDRTAHMLVRSIYEEAATGSLRFGAADMRTAALGELDKFPVGMRADMGNFLLGALSMVRDEPDLWKLRHMRAGAGGPHIVFGATGRYTAELHDGFGTWVQLKHHNLQRITKQTDLLTVGVLLTPRTDGLRPFDTSISAVGGDLELTDDDLNAYRAVWDPNGLYG